MRTTVNHRTLALRLIRSSLLALCAVGTCSCAETDFTMGWREAEEQPIECHVAFVDQAGNPIANAHVDAAVVTHKPGNTGADEKPLRLVTDAEGKIHVAGERGGALWLKVADPRFLAGSTQKFDKGGISLTYSRINGDPHEDYGTAEHPRVIQVWRREGPQPLSSLAGRIDVPYVGKSFSIDLATGEILDHGGDLTITIKQPRSEEEFSVAAKAIGPDALRLGVFPWSCEVRANSGAFYEVSADEFDRKVFGVYGRPMIKGRSFTFNGAGNVAELYAIALCRSDKLNGKFHLRITSGQKSNEERCFKTRRSETPILPPT